MSDPDRADPILIHGILPRSGTNFLCDLLLLHPDCARGREPVREDLFLEHSDHLVAFAQAVRGAWDPNWGTFGSDITGRLCSGIGDGLLSFLHVDRERRLVTKSPSVRHLDRVFTLFPSARVLLLVRDGRSVVHSSMATFGWDFDRACRAWAEAADTIRLFAQAESARADQWRLVRYEDLVDDTEGQLRAILQFVGLDAARYDFVAARDLPVRGSSAFGLRPNGVHWDQVAKDASFAPKERWRSWNATQLERFDWLAGAQLAYFGYAGTGAIGTRDVSERRASPIRALKHRALDVRWHTARAMRRTMYRTRVRVGTALQPLRRRLGLLREA